MDWIGFFIFVLYLGAVFSRSSDAQNVSSASSACFGYELMMIALEDFNFRTQKDMEDSKLYTQKVISNVDTLEKSVVNNTQMLEVQKMNIDELGHQISQLLDDKRIQQVIEESKQYYQTSNSNMENLQKTISHNERMLEDLRKDIEDLVHKFTHLSEETSKLIKLQQTFNDTIMQAIKDASKLPETCRDVSGRWSGIRKLQPRPEFSPPFDAYCDQEYEGGGWTVIQNRFDGKVNFYRGWKEYEKGFGDLDGEFWLGLKNMHHLTNAKQHELHVVMEDFEGKRVVAKYSHMVVGSANEQFSLKNLGTYSGDAGDSFSHSLNMKFSTFDKDNDLGSDRNCAEEFSGAWWYNSCHESNLNGMYVEGKSEIYAKMMCWWSFKGFYYGLKSSRMMIRAKN